MVLKPVAEQLYCSTVMWILGPGHHSLPFPARKATERVKDGKEKERESPAALSLYPCDRLTINCPERSKAMVTGQHGLQCTLCAITR